MKGKRIGTSVLAALMLAGTTATSALAAMPDKSVVIGEKAFKLTYVNAKENRAEVRAILVDALTDGEKIYIKSRNVWYNNDETKLADTSVIPAVVYKTTDGEVSYEAGDGEEATEGFMIKEISATGIKNVTATFTEAVTEKDQEKTTFVVKKGSKTKNFSKVEWNEEGTEAVIAMDSKIGEGEYSVEVKGLDLEDKKRTFTAENERIEQVVVNSGDKLPEIAADPTDKDDDAEYFVQFRYEVQNQYGEEVSFSPSVTLNGSFDVKKKTDNYAEFKYEGSKFDNPLVEEFPISVTVIATYNNTVQTAQYLGKVVDEATISKGEIGKLYEKNSKDELVEVTAATESDAGTLYIALELEDQYGNDVDSKFLSVRGVDFSKTVEVDMLDELAQYDNFSFDAGEDTLEFVLNPGDEDDTTVYAKIAREFVNYSPVYVTMVVGNDVNSEVIKVDESTVIDQLNVELPEIMVAGEVAEFQSVEAFDKNGDAIEGEDLYAKLTNDDGTVNDDILDTNNGSIEVAYNETTEEVELSWNLTEEENNGNYDKTISLQIITETNQPNSILGSMKPEAYAVEISLVKDSLSKMAPETSQTLNLEDNIVVYDQYDRAMDAEVLAKANNVKFAVDGVSVDGELNDDLDNREWDIDAAGSETTTSGTIQLIKLDKDGKVKLDKDGEAVIVSEADIKIETVDLEDIVEIVVETPKTIYGGPEAVEEDNDYTATIKVHGETENGTSVIIDQEKHYNLSISSDNIDVSEGELKVTEAFDKDMDDTEYTLIVTQFGLENVEEAEVETVTVSVATPKLTTFEAKDEKTVVTHDEKTLTVEDFMKFIVAEDQYGVEYSKFPSTIVYKGADVEEASLHNLNGSSVKDSAVIAKKLTNGDKFTVQVYYGSKSVELKVVIDNISAE